MCRVDCFISRHTDINITRYFAHALLKFTSLDCTASHTTHWVKPVLGGSPEVGWPFFQIHRRTNSQHTMPHMRHTQRTAATGTKIEIYTTVTSEGCDVGAGEDVVMGIMVGIVNSAVGCWQERNIEIWLKSFPSLTHVHHHLQLYNKKLQTNLRKP